MASRADRGLRPPGPAVRDGRDHRQAMEVARPCRARSGGWEGVVDGRHGSDRHRGVTGVQGRGFVGSTARFGGDVDGRGGGSSRRCSSRRWPCCWPAAWRGWPGRAGGPTPCGLRRRWSRSSRRRAGWWRRAAADAGVDLIAVLALLGTLAVGEYLAGALIAVMLATGRALDAAAQRRATRDLRALLEHAPRSARRRVGDVVTRGAARRGRRRGSAGRRPGRGACPSTGVVEAPSAVLDESALTGEPLLVERAVGESVRSGVVNAGGAFELRATATAGQSTYAGIVAAGREAGAESAPVVRLADRYAAWFLPLSLAVAGRRGWAAGRPYGRSPCWWSRRRARCCWRRRWRSSPGCRGRRGAGWSIRGGGALENLGRAATLVLDKTGTLTAGRPARRRGRRRAGPRRPPRCCGWPPRPTSCPRTCSPRRSSPRRARAGWSCRCRATSTEEPGRGVTATVDGVRVRRRQTGRRTATPTWAARGAQPGPARRLRAVPG